MLTLILEHTFNNFITNLHIRSDPRVLEHRVSFY